MAALSHASQDAHLVAFSHRRMAEQPARLDAGIQDVFQTTRSSLSPETVVRSARMSCTCSTFDTSPMKRSSVEVDGVGDVEIVVAIQWSVFITIAVLLLN